MRFWKLGILARIFLFSVTAFLILYPLVMMLIGTFRSEIPGIPGTWGFKGWIDAYTNPEFLTALWTTFIFAVFKTLAAVSLAIAFAWFIHRTDMPGRRLLDSGLHLAFFILPPLPVILGWITLFSPKAGIVNKWFKSFFDVGFPLFDIYSLTGMVLVSASFSIPLYYMFLSPAFKSMDITLEEAAKVSGASNLTTFRRIILPLLMPAILSVTMLSFILGMESFEVPVFLGGPQGIDVLSTLIYSYIHSQANPNYMAALSTGVTLIALTIILVIAQWKILGGRQFVTVTGKGYRPRRMSLGLWRWPAFILLAGTFFILKIPAVVMVVMNAFMKVPGVFSGITGGPWTLRNFVEAFKHPQVLTAVKNTLILGATAPLISLVLCTFIAYIVVKTKFREKRILEFIAWLPWAVPGIVMSLAMLWAWIFIQPFGFSLYGSMTLVILVMVTVGFPLATRIMTSTVAQIHSELEESARVSGASWFTTLFRIWMPLLRNGLISVWLIQFSTTVRVLAPVILITGATTTVLSTTFFNFWKLSDLGPASVIGLLQGIIITGAYLVASIINRLAGRRIPEEKSALGN